MKKSKMSGLFGVALLIGGAVLLSSISSFAYRDGTYNCKNRQGLPDNTYTLRTISVGESLNVPYLEAVRFYRDNASDANSAIVESKLKGFASTITSSKGGETLILAAVHLEIENGIIKGCARQ